MPRDNATQVQVRNQDENDRFEEARTALKQIFDLLGIERVIVVDDDLDSEPELKDFTRRCFRFFNENLQRLRCVQGLELQEGVEEDFDEDIRPQLEDIWRELDEAGRREQMEKLDWIAPDKTVAALEEVCDGYKPQFMSLKEWKDGFSENTSDDDVLAKTIFLFDLDMSKEKGGREDEGMRLISEMLKSGKNCQCALFSHLVQEDTEYKSWREYVKEYELKEYQHDFVVISKKHLPKAPLAFAQRLKRAAIAPLCDDLTDEVVKVLDAALVDAKKEIDDLNIYDFEEIVFQSSHNEGVWEPDTVLRILALYTQRSARRLLKENKRIEDAAAQVRKVIDLPYRPSDAPLASSSRKILRLERYEDKSFLDEHHIPLDLGDIFRNDNGQEFVLLAQQCNLMCRNSSDSDRPNTVAIAPLVSMGKVRDTSRLWEMEAYATGKNEYMYVNFLEVVSAPILALDLTVFNNDGKSTFRVDSACPLNVIPAWRKRHEQVSDEVKSIVGRYMTASTQLADDLEAEPMAADDAEEVVPDNGADAQQLLCQALTSSVPGVVAGAIDIENRVISYNIERVSRLKPPYASALLRAYAAYLARDGFDHDLTRTIEKPRAS